MTAASIEMEGERFEVRIQTGFVASHRRGAGGEEEPLHEHDWKVAVRAGAAELSRMAVVIDFRKLQEMARGVLEELEGTVLEEHPDFATVSPTAAAVAAWIYGRLRDEVASSRCRLAAIEVEADPGVVFEYRGSPSGDPGVTTSRH